MLQAWKPESGENLKKFPLYVQTDMFLGSGHCAGAMIEDKRHVIM